MSLLYNYKEGTYALYKTQKEGIFSFFPNSCGQLGHQWKEHSWELPLSCIRS